MRRVGSIDSWQVDIVAATRHREKIGDQVYPDAWGEIACSVPDLIEDPKLSFPHDDRLISRP